MAAPLAQAQDAGPYRISQGDVLRIEVSSRSDLSTQYTVAEGGTITVQGFGAIRAAGRTANELADDLSRRLSLVERQIPRVTVTVIESRARQTVVLGAVIIPGVYNLPQNGTVWSAIELAGGASEDAELSSVEVLPGDIGSGRKSVTVDVAAAIRENRIHSLDPLRPGDTVRVPRKSETLAGRGDFVYLFGAVGAPGAVPMEQALDLHSLIVRPGGASGDADLRRVEIVRRTGSRYAHLRVNFSDYLHASNSAGNVVLQAGDTVFLPRREPPRNYFSQILGIVSPALALAATVLALTNR